MKKTLIIVVGPSGAGKSSFVDKIIDEVDYLVDTVTFTTRGMRSGESEGHPYHFVSREKFEALIKEDYFVEWAEVHGNLYGTPHVQIEDIWKQGKSVIMDVDVQGAHTFKKRFPEESFTLFIKPPDMEALRERVIKRDGATTTPEQLEVRMENAKHEMSLADNFDAQLINSEFESSYAQFKKIIEDYLKNS
tara:strand:- start:87159 stop:87731 length:573 start_codon:yes stop_codon:yes gene_type:complete